MTSPDVDSNWVGYTGASAGGVMTLIASAVDSRCSFAAPLLTSGTWDVAAECEGAWFYEAVGDSIPPDDERVERFLRFLDPVRYCGARDIPVLLIVGAQDEFFPINAVAAYCDSCLGGVSRFRPCRQQALLRLARARDSTQT